MSSSSRKASAAAAAAAAGSSDDEGGVPNKHAAALKRKRAASTSSSSSSEDDRRAARKHKHSKRSDASERRQKRARLAEEAASSSDDEEAAAAAARKSSKKAAKRARPADSDASGSSGGSSSEEGKEPAKVVRLRGKYERAVARGNAAKAEKARARLAKRGVAVPPFPSATAASSSSSSSEDSADDDAVEAAAVARRRRRAASKDDSESGKAAAATATGSDAGITTAARSSPSSSSSSSSSSAAAAPAASGSASAAAPSSSSSSSSDDRETVKVAKLQRKLGRALARGDEEKAARMRRKLAKRGISYAATEAAAAAGDEGALEDVLREGERIVRMVDEEDRRAATAAATASSSESAASGGVAAAAAAGGAGTGGGSSSSSASSAAAGAPAFTIGADGKRIYPPAPKPTGNTSLLLFYAYVVPPWSHKERAHAIEYTHRVLSENKCGGRLRVALEGFNATLTGPPEGLRAFVAALQTWLPEHFGETDFKFVDGLPDNKAFKGLKVWPVTELVNYGFKVGQADLKHGGTHVSPAEWIAYAKQPDTVLIDVRNANETAIGRFIPPPGGATLLDPRMRRSTEFAGWVAANLPLLKAQKRVMMVCTAGVRCERASALVAEMGVDRDKIVQLKGGIHRYLDAYGEDGGEGLWQGLNYVFDKRFGHGAEKREGVVGKCACCHGPWERYQAQAKCAVCRMETLLCRDCERSGRSAGVRLLCWLCEEAKATGGAAALANMRKAAEFAKTGGGRDGEGEGASAAADHDDGAARAGGGGGAGGRGGGRGGFRGGRGGGGRS